MNQENNSDIPVEFENQNHKALVSVWWTGNLLKKSFLRIFKGTFRSEAQFNLLRIIKYFEGPHTQKDLATKLLINKSNITLLIDSLEKAGFVQRLKVKNDRRSYHIAFTKDGKDKFDVLDAKYEELIAALSSSFTDKDQEDLNRITGKVRDNLARYFAAKGFTT